MRTSARVLIVDDESAFACTIQAGLESMGYTVLGVATSAAQAIDKVQELSPDVVLMDINLEGPADGVEAAEEIAKKKKVPIIFMTGLSDEETVTRAKLTGSYGYLVKPFHIRELAPAIEVALHKHQKETEREELLSKTLKGSVEVLTEILSSVDPDAFGRSQRLTELVNAMGKQLQLTSLWELEVAAMLAPVGYVCIPGHVVQRYRNGVPLSFTEKTMISRVPEFGSKLLARIPNLEGVSRIILYQNKNFDGTGFPNDEVSGLNIPIGARVLKIVNTFIDLETVGESKVQIIEHFTTAKGIYDPKLVLEAINSIIDAPPAGSKPVHLKDLSLGQILRAAIETNDGTILVAPGVKISSLVIDRLSNFSQLAGIKEPIYVEA